MAVNTIEYAGGLTADTNRGPTPDIWANCPVFDLLENPRLGMYVWDDFTTSGNAVMSSAYTAGIGQWSVYGAAGALLGDGGLEGGVITIGSDGDNEGVTFGTSSAAFRVVTTSTNALNGKLWFEARIARSTVSATTIECFVGLFNSFLSSSLPQAAFPISVTDNTLANCDLLGFHNKGNAPTEVNFAYKLTGGSTVYPTSLTTLMASSGNAVLTANGFVKLGFIFDPQAYTAVVSTASTGQTAGNYRRKILRIFVNGLELPAFLTTDNTAGGAFPTAFMCPGFAVMNQAGTSPGTMLIDWIRCAQLANS